MTGRHGFQYAVLRCVPRGLTTDPARQLDHLLHALVG